MEITEPNEGRPEVAVASKLRDRLDRWRPIETAPMDGSEILLCLGKRVTSGCWLTGVDLGEMAYHGTTGEPVGYPDAEEYTLWMSWDGGFKEEEPPTHWMPLPAPAI